MQRNPDLGDIKSGTMVMLDVMGYFDFRDWQGERGGASTRVCIPDLGTQVQPTRNCFVRKSRGELQLADSEGEDPGRLHEPDQDGLCATTANHRRHVSSTTATIFPSL